jgi:hypothetical protein
MKNMDKTMPEQPAKVLSADEIGDSKWSMLEQGRAAARAVIEWLASEDPPREEELAERIPRRERREDCYPTRVRHG